jgi:hypothetical protein
MPPHNRTAINFPPPFSVAVTVGIVISFAMIHPAAPIIYLNAPLMPWPVIASCLRLGFYRYLILQAGTPAIF